MISGLMKIGSMKIIPARSSCLAASLLSAALGVPAGHAADAKPKAQSQADKILTPAQLRECHAQQTKVRQQDADSLRQRQSLDAEKADIARLAETLQAQLATLDRSNAEAIDAYNEQVQVREKRIDAYQAGVDQYNAKVASLQSDHDALARSCDNKRFLEDDETAIKKGK